MKRATVACALALMVSATAHATVLRPMSAADLTDQAELIFTGIAVERQVATSRDGRYPFTFVTFEVESILKGEVAGDRLTLRFEGGELGEEYIEVIGMPEFEHGGEYLLFVADNGHAISPVVGWGQGKFELVEHPSRPGEKILIDRHGNAIEGVGDGAFLRTPVERDGGSVRRAAAVPTGVEVLEEVGVVISDPMAPDFAKVGTELAPANFVLQGIQRLVVNRIRAEGFRPGRRVRSLTVDDVPERFSYESPNAQRR